MADQLFSQLVQISYSISIALFVAQGWLFQKQTYQTRILRLKHSMLILSIFFNIVSIITLYFLINVLLQESLKQTKTFTSDCIDFSRILFTGSALISLIFTIIAYIVWNNTKNERGTKT